MYIAVPTQWPISSLKRASGQQSYSIGSSEYVLDIVAITLPVAILMGLAAICIGVGLYVQKRSTREFEHALDGLSRLRREAAIGVPRSRAVINILEETLKNANRAFGLQLWVSRTLFVVGLGLLVAFVGNAIISGEWDRLTATLGAGSALSLLPLSS
jgi:hypothetical protein